jgi:RNA polymerase sigma-70 factor (ECF subfamily)
MDDTTNPRSFEDFYSATKSPVLRAVLVARAGARQESEDAVAEAYEKAYLRWEALSAHPCPTAWVIRTAINQRVSMWRRARRRVEKQNAETSLVSEALDPSLVRRVNALPQRQREVLALRILLDLSTEQTAEILRVHQGTVKTQLHRALQTLRSGLGTHDLEEAWL